MKYSLLSLILFLMVALVLLGGRDKYQRKLRVETTQSEDDPIVPYRDICPERTPQPFAILHERRTDHKEHYEKTIGTLVNNWNPPRLGDTPKVKVLQNARFAVWKPKEFWRASASAWNEELVVEGPGWEEPKVKNRVDRTLWKPKHYVAFATWFPENYGHFVHDHLPTIAFLKQEAPDDAMFLLIDTPVARNVLQFIDPDFFQNRVTWITMDKVYEIKGDLTVAVPVGIPIVRGCCGGFDPLRRWLATQHPFNPDKKIVLFYTRGGSEDNHHGRVVEANHEKEILEHIRQAMKKHNRSEELVIFDGQENGKTMSIAKQFQIFRSASTVIGPHGSGFGGNFAWTNPFPTNCEERVKLLEFIPGQDSASVQRMYASYFLMFRKWPMEHHSILYTEKSSWQTTYINLQDLNDALDDMWGPRESESASS